MWQPCCMPQDANMVRLELTADEVLMLTESLTGWAGPARGTDSLAVTMGFSSLEHGLQEGPRVARAIGAGQALTVRNWTRALVAAEFAFASDVLGWGGEWTVIQGGTDSYWLGVLRGLQRKVPSDRRYLGP